MTTVEDACRRFPVFYLPAVAEERTARGRVVQQAQPARVEVAGPTGGRNVGGRVTDPRMLEVWAQVLTEAAEWLRREIEQTKEEQCPRP